MINAYDFPFKAMTNKSTSTVAVYSNYVSHITVDTQSNLLGLCQLIGSRAGGLLELTSGDLVQLINYNRRLPLIT